MDLKELGFRDEKTLDEVDERDLEARIARRPKPISTRSLARSSLARSVVARLLEEMRVKSEPVDFSGGEMGGVRKTHSFYSRVCHTCMRCSPFITMII